MSEATEEVISGLEGVLACESSIAYIDGSIPELSFRGYDIHDIAQTLTFEQVAFLIWHDRIPNASELRAFSADLAGRRAIPRQIMDVLRATPSAAHPMAGLRTAVSMLGTMDPRAEDISPEDNLRKAQDLTAQMPTIVAAQARLQRGQEPIAPEPTLSHAANYCYMLTGKLPGFGHRVYRAGDPRASQLRGMAEKLGQASGDDKWFAIATAAEQRMRDAKGIIANVDYFAAPVLYHLGFPLNVFTNVIASTRIVGWSAHMLEQYANNRLIRPRALYTGHRGRKLGVN